MDAKRREEIIQRDLAASREWTKNKMKEQAAAVAAKAQSAVQASKTLAEEKAKPKAEESFIDNYSPSNLYKKIRGTTK